METPPDLPELFTADLAAARQTVRAALADGRNLLNSAETAALLQAYGIASVSYTHLDVYKRQVLCLGPVEQFYAKPMLELEGWAARQPLHELVGENGWPRAQ